MADDLFAPPSKEEIEATQNFGVMDYAKDWGRSLLGGPRRGLESLPATGGDIYGLLNTVESTARGATAPEQQRLYDERDKERPRYLDEAIPGVPDVLANVPLLPNSAEVERATEEATTGTGIPYLDTVFGEHYEPQTRVGSFLNNLGATVFGGGGRHFIRDEILPAAGATVGAEVGNVLGGNAGAQFGSLIGGGAASTGHEYGMRRLIPEATDPVRGQIRSLSDPGPDPNNPLTPVELTGGQALDSPTLKYIEAGPFASKAAGIGEDQARQFTQRALELGGVRGSDRADFATMTRAQQELSARYENMVRSNNGIVMQDPMLQQALIDAGVNYQRVKGTNPNSIVEHYYNRIADASQQHGGVLPPDVFQAIHSEMSADLTRLRNSPEMAQEAIGIRDMEGALFDALGRSNNPDVAAQAQALNRQYRNFKILEDAMYSTSADAARGIVTPAALAMAVKRSESKAGFTQGRSDFADLANAGSSLMKDIGNTGSGGRAGMAAMGGGVAAGLGMLMSGQPMAGAAAVGSSLAAPFVPMGISRAVTSQPVRTSLVSRRAGDAPSYWEPLAIQAASPAVNLGIGQRASEPPVPVEPPEDPEQQSMLENDYPVPVDLTDPADILRRRGLRYG